nr:unnamed protein product [Callosobruchus chinensis]
MSAHKLSPHLTRYLYERCFQIANNIRPRMSSNFMHKALLLRFCVYQLKRVLQLLNNAPL